MLAAKHAQNISGMKALESHFFFNPLK